MSDERLKDLVVEEPGKKYGDAVRVDHIKFKKR